VEVISLTVQFSQLFGDQMSVRTEKIASLLKTDLSDIVRVYQNNTMITITDVTITPDLAVAKVFFSILGGNAQSVFQHLEEHNSEIRYKLSKKIRNQMRRMPELMFYLDNTAEVSDKMDEIFKKIQYSSQPEETND
jgi:ribosome-binding factor A